jgi:hypothetical protein
MNQSISCATCDADLSKREPVRFDGDEKEIFCDIECRGRFMGRLEARESLFESATEIQALWEMLRKKIAACKEVATWVYGDEIFYRRGRFAGFDPAGAVLEYGIHEDKQTFLFSWELLAMSRNELIDHFQRQYIEGQQADLRMMKNRIATYKANTTNT